MSGNTIKNKIGTVSSGKIKPTTIFLDPDLHNEVKLYAVALEMSMTDFIHDALREKIKSTTGIKKRINEVLNS